VNVVTASPKLETYEASGSLEYGNYELLHTEGMVNVPVGDKFALRAAFSTTVHDGYLSNGAEGEDEKAARLKGLYQARETLSFEVTGEISKSGGTGFGGGVVPFIDESDTSDPWEGNDNGSLGSNDQTKKSLKGSMEVDLPLGSLSLIPAYSKGDGEWDMTMTDMSGDAYDQHAFQESEEKSVELRMSSSPDFFFKWIAGVTYYESSDSNRRVSADFQETGEGYWSRRTMEEEASAFFGNLTYPVMDTLRFTLGYRYSNDELISVNEEWTMNPPNGQSWTEYGMWRTENLTENDGRSDYKVGFEYDLAENSMLYGDYSTSYRVQGGQSGGEWPCEELIAYTLGAKNRFMDNKLQVNIGAYYYDYQNFFARQMLMFQAKNGDMVMEPNASQYGDGRMLGFDLQTSLIITPKDRVNLSVSYIDSEWTDLYFDYYYDDEYEDTSYNGKPMKNTPPWTVNASYDRRFNLPNGGDLSGRVDLKYQTGYRLTWMDGDYPYNWQETHFMGDISAVYTSPDGQWTLSGYVKNITDYAEKRMYNSAGDASLSIGNPRTYGAIFTVKY
jgi:iron complex outermembrane receptor protein